MTLWTQRAAISWKQNIGFFEHRYDVLRDIEQKGLLRRFQDRPSQTAVRLQGPHQVVTFGAEGVFFGLFKPDADLGVVRAAVEAVCNALEPELTGFPVFNFKWLNPCEMSYDKARDVVATALVGKHNPGHVTDFAVVLDGKFEAPFDDYHLEIGVVEAAETPHRLASGLSRGENERDSPPGLWSVEQLPPVAVFCEVELDRSKLDPGDTVEDIFSAFGSARDLADGLMSSVLTPLKDRKL
jgi:hypothetical protein